MEGKKQAFCTLSESPRHDPPAIWAHVLPVLKEHMTEDITCVHLQSDSPSTQYRNKDMFQLTCALLPLMYPQVKTSTHNFTEGGHSKGGPDGLGGWAKSTADEEVKHGKDISNMAAMASLLRAKAVNVFIETISPSAIQSMSQHVCQENEPFYGTMKVHQYIWSSEHPTEVFFNSVSCYRCPAGSKCSHYALPNSPWKLRGIPVRPAQQSMSTPTPESSLKKGDWIAVAYGLHWYPGKHYF